MARDPDDKYRGPQYTRGAMAWDIPEEFHHTHWVGERTAANIERAVQDGQALFPLGQLFRPPSPLCHPRTVGQHVRPRRDAARRAIVEGEFDDMPPQYAKTREEQPRLYDVPRRGRAGPARLSLSPAQRPGTAAEHRLLLWHDQLIDQEVGRILDTLDRLGIAENTLVLFSTDHGHFLGQHGLIAKGAFHYEDMLRIPMIVRYPGHGAGGHPLERAAVPGRLAGDVLARGRDRGAGLDARAEPARVWAGDDTQARDWVLVENRHNPTTVHLRTLVTDRYKITVYRDAPMASCSTWKRPGRAAQLLGRSALRGVKADLLLQFVQAEIQREPTRMPRIAGA